MRRLTCVTGLTVMFSVVAPSSGTWAQSAANVSTFAVTLLGTGTPRPSLERFGPSTLVEVGDQRLVFDSGRGVTIRLTQLGVPLREVTAVFLTHFHSDHVNGLADLWLTGWLPRPWGGRTTPFRVYGPTGTEKMMTNIEAAHQADIRIRIADERLPPAGIAVSAHDVTGGVIYETGGVRVTVFDVDHGDAIKPAVGYRVDYQGRSVVISGDTRYSTNLVEHATGADVVIHEVMAVPDQHLESEAMRRIMDHHTSPEDAGRVFAESGARLAVYSHVILAGYADPESGLSELLRRTRTTYAGGLEVGRDLMTIDVSDTPSVRQRIPAQP